MSQWSRTKAIELEHFRTPLIRRNQSTSSDGSATPTPRQLPWAEESMWFEAGSDGVASPRIEPCYDLLSLVDTEDGDNDSEIFLRALEEETPSEMVEFEESRYQIERKLTRIAHQKAAARKESLKTTAVIGAVGGVVGIALAPIAAPVVLGAVGFTSTGGIVSGSLAASIQAGLGGNIVAGSSFAIAQSVASGGALPLFGHAISGAILGCATAAASAKKWLSGGK